MQIMCQYSYWKISMCSLNDHVGELFQEKNNDEFEILYVCIRTMLRIKRGEELFNSIFFHQAVTLLQHFHKNIIRVNKINR